MNDENIIKWLKEHNENAFKEHNILEITDPKEVIMVEKEEYYNLKKENQRLNNVLNELEKWLNSVVEYETLHKSGYITYRGELAKEILGKLNELKESDK